MDISPPMPWRSTTWRKKKAQMAKNRTMGMTQERIVRIRVFSTVPVNSTPYFLSSLAICGSTRGVTKRSLPSWGSAK